MKNFYYSFIIILSALLLIINNTKAQVPNNQDCLGAIPVCQNVYTQSNSYSGTGNYLNEIDGVISCMDAGEKNDVWYIFTVQSSGNVNFLITPNDACDDYDWAVYNLTNANCSDIYSNSSLEVSCNWSAEGGPTGPNGGSGYTSQDAFGSRFNAEIPVTAGQTYVVNISNYSSTQYGYTLNFGASSATIFDNIPPYINSINPPVCGATSLTFDFSENVLCNTVEDADFTFTGPGGTYTLSGVTGAACSVGGTQENTYTINVSPSITVSGNYNLCIDANASGSVADLCDNLAPSDCLPFTINAVTSSITNITDATCGSNNGSATVTASGGSPPYTYNWNTTPPQTNATATNLGPGTYIVTVGDQTSCVSIDTAIVNSIGGHTVTITKTDDNCGQHIGSATATPSPSGSYTYNWNTVPPQATATATNIGGGNYSVTVSDGVCDVIATVTINDLQSLSVTTSYTDDNCGQHTGTATAIASGSPGVPTYEWNTTPPQTTATAVNLGAGIYSVTVTDGTCVVINNVTIGDTPSPTANITNHTDEMCGNSNGTATVTATGGEPSYSYTWNTNPQQNTATAINLPAGTYIVTVTDINNCSDTASVTILSIPGPTAIITNTSDENCGNSDGSATVTATGGLPQYSYTWNTNPTQYDTTAINLASGVYTVTVTDANNCTDTATATINFIPGPVITINSTDEHCGHSDGTATAIVTGGTGVYTYLWDTNPPQNTESINNLSAGFYTIVVSDGPCSSIVTVEIANIPGPVASFTVYPEITTLENAGCSFTDHSQGNISSWQWDFGDGESSSEQDPYHTYTDLGTYIIVLTVTDSYGCTDSTKRTVIIKSVFTVYIPNSFTPDQDGLNETFGPVCNGIDKDGYEMFIFDRWGGEIYSTNDILKQWDGTKNNVNVPVGTYAYHIVVKEEYSDKKYEYIGKVNLIR